MLLCQEFERDDLLCRIGDRQERDALPLLPADHEGLEDRDAAFGLDVPRCPRPEVGDGWRTVHNRVIPGQIHPGPSQNPLPPRPYLPAENACEHFLQGTLQRIRGMLFWGATAAPAAIVKIPQEISPFSNEIRKRPLL